MCGTDPCVPLYAPNAVRGAAIDAEARRCGAEVAPRGAVAVEVRERPGSVRVEARLISGAGIVLEMTPAAARSIASCLDRAAEGAGRPNVTDTDEAGAAPPAGGDPPIRAALR